MRCTVYKSLAHRDTYLYLRRDLALQCLPTGLQKVLGRLEHVLDLDLQPGRKLARVDATAVLVALAEPGYFVQGALGETDEAFAGH